MNNYLLFFVPTLVGLISIRFLPFNLKKFQGLFLLFAISIILLQMLVFPGVNLTKILLGFLIGEMVHVLSIGILGNKISPANHAGLLFGFGLFPWWIGSYQSIFYILIFILVLAIGSFFQLKIANKSFGLKTMHPNTALKQLQEKDLKSFRKKAGVVFSDYFFVSTVLIMVLTIVS